MDELGYYALWTAEHHFQHEGYEVFPNLILLGTWLATQTRRLKFGCAFNVLPMWHPIRLAEDFAQADIMTGGRVIMGVGRGYHTREVETFGAPMLDNKANQELFEEQMEVLLKCFNEESWSHKGKHYTIPAPVEYRGYPLKEITVVPRPLNLPVEIWQPIASGKTLPYIAQRGIKGMVTLNGERIFDQVVRAYQAEAAKAGRDAGARRGHLLGRGPLPGRHRRGGGRARRALPRRALQVVRALRLRALRRRGRAARGACRARPRACPAFARAWRRRAWLCGPPVARDRADPRVRVALPGARAHDDPLGRRHAAEGVQGTALLVRRDVMPAFAGRR